MSLSKCEGNSNKKSSSCRPLSAGQKDKIKKSRCKSCLQKRFLTFYQMIFGHISGIWAKKMVGIGRFDGEAQPDEPEHCEGNSNKKSSSCRPLSAGQKDKIKKSRCKSCLQKRFLTFYQMIFGHISGIWAKKMVGIGRFDGEAQPDEPEHCEGNSNKKSSSCRPLSAGQKDKIKKSRCKSCLQKRFLTFYQMIFGHISGIWAKKMVGIGRFELPTF